MNHFHHPRDNDELEQRLRSELRDYAPEAPDNLWRGIEAKLPRRRPAVLLWWLAGAATGLMLMGILYRLGEEACSLPQSGAREIATTARQQAAGTDGGATLPVKKIVERSEPGGNVEPVKPNTAGHFEKTVSQTPDVLPEKIPALPIAKSFDKKNKPGVDPEKPAIDPMESLPRISPGIECIRNVNLPLIKTATRLHRERRWSVGAVAGPAWVWQTATPGHQHMGALAVTERSDSPATGWQTGLSAGVTLMPGWQLNLGLLQRSTVQVSSHSAMLRLIDGQCINPGDPGPKEYEFRYTLHSSGSETAVRVRIAETDSPGKMPADEPFTMDMQTTRRNTDWVLPLTLQYNIGTGRWRAFAQGGGQLLVPGKSAVQADHFTQACMDLCFANGHQPDLTVKENRQAAVAWTLGLGVEYRLAKRWTLSAAPAFFGEKDQTGLALQAGLHLKI